MSTYEPNDGLRAALTAVDLGEADWIITPDPEVAGWAQGRGYHIVRDDQHGMRVYEIRAGGEAFMIPGGSGEVPPDQ